MDVQTTSSIFIMCLFPIHIILWDLENSLFYFRIIVSKVENLKLNMKHLKLNIMIIDSMMRCIKLLKVLLNKVMESEVVTAQDAVLKCMFMVTVKQFSQNFLCTCVEKFYECMECGKYKCTKHPQFGVVDSLHMSQTSNWFQFAASCRFTCFTWQFISCKI